MNALGTPEPPQLRRTLRRVALYLSVGVTVGAGAVLLLWMTGGTALQTSLTPLLEPNAALCLVLEGAALWMLNGTPPGWRDALARILAGVAILIAMLTFFEDLGGRDLGLDALLVRGAMPAVHALHPPLRIATTVSGGIVLLGLGILVMDWRTLAGRGIGALFAFTALVTSGLALLGQLYGVAALFWPSWSSRTSATSAAMVMVLATAILISRPHMGPLRLVSADTLGGLVARRLLIPAVLIPVALGYLELRGDWLDYYQTEAGVSLLVIASIAIFVGLIWTSARSLDVIDARRRDSDQILAEQSRMVVHLYEGARKAVQVREDFISIASHELKTPLTSLKLQAEMMRKLAGSLPSSEASQRLLRSADASMRQVARLVRLVDDMLDVTRIAAGKLRLERTEMDLAQLTRELVARFSSPMAEVGGSIALDEPGGPVVGSWDAYRLEQVLTNLFTNALKYGQGKPVEVTLQARPDRVVIEVRDHGMGIRPEDRDRIFERFERAVSANEISGVGLGLYIARQLAESHGGRLTVESGGDDGTAFTLELPRSPDPEHAEPPSLPPSGAGTGRPLLH